MLCGLINVNQEACNLANTWLLSVTMRGVSSFSSLLSCSKNLTDLAKNPKALLVLPCLEPPLGELRYGAGPEYMRCG
jgi:hypothetical protein